MKRSFMRSRNDAKLCLAAGPYLRRPLYPVQQTAMDRSPYGNKPVGSTKLPSRCTLK